MTTSNDAGVRAGEQAPDGGAAPPQLRLDTVRARFPALAARTPDGRAVVHADAPGGTQVPLAVIDAIADHLRAGTANAHGVFAASRAVDDLCEHVRRQAAAFLGGWPEGIVFGPNMTTLTMHVADALAATVRDGDRIVCTRLDHDANVSPWLHLARRTGAVVDWVDLDPETGTLDLSTLRVDDRTRVVAFPAASNALGTLVDPAPFVAAADAAGAVTVMDAVHAAPHVALDQRGAGVDVVVTSPYKYFGPHAGVLSADPALLARWVPRKARPAPDGGPERWQQGTPAFEAIAGIGAALEYLSDIGMPAITAHERMLTQRFLSGVADLDGVRLHGVATVAGRTPTFALTVAGRQPIDVARGLADDGIRCWAGHYYAIEPMRRLRLLGSGGAVRIGFVHYHGPDDVDRVIAALTAEVDEAR